MDEINSEQQELLKQEHASALKKLIGTYNQGKGLVDQARSHQGWWRAVVLGLPEGQYYDKTNKEWKRVCNRTFPETSDERVNFLTENSLNATKTTLEDRGEASKGIIEEGRLNFNLLSSQPLCFNFFGELMSDKEFGLRVLQQWWPNLTALRKVIFEYAPEQNYTGDSSAFDVAFEVAIGNQIGIVGLECKYTDTFSYRPSKSKFNYGDKENKNHDTYKALYDNRKHRFLEAYYDIVRNNGCNQLFRNQLIAESVLQNELYAFAYTGLFCFEKDEHAQASGREFKDMLAQSEEFSIITYFNFIQKVQRLDLSSEQREWTMLLWARYCALSLSQKATGN